MPVMSTHATSPAQPTSTEMPAVLPDAAPATVALNRLLRVGPLLLLLAGIFWGAMGVHSSTDVWIALATGRYIFETGHVPTTDPFSYTFNGKPWFDQNWLSHALYYWLYKNIAPGAVVFFVWGVNLFVYGGILYFVRRRSGSWLAALLTTGVVACCIRHYLDARPQTPGYLCMAALIFLFHYLSQERARQPWWPALLALPVMLFWGACHGTFVFGYGLIGLFIAGWVISPWLRLWPVAISCTWLGVLAGIVLMYLQLKKALNTPGSLGQITPENINEIVFGVFTIIGALSLLALRFDHIPATWQQIVTLAGAAVSSFLITLLFGPYGWGNFAHSFLVTEAPIFRQIVEWRPPWIPTHQGLSVLGFWVGTSILAICTLVIVSCWLQARLSAEQPATPERASRPTFTVFDLALILMGLGMALWARRFATLYYITTSVPVAIALVRLALDLRPNVRLVLARLACTAALVGGLYMGCLAWARTQYQMVDMYRGKPGFDLLERYVDYRSNPIEAFRILRQLDVPVHAFAEWTVAGILLFDVPKGQVFMDGRSQQVFDEKHYMLYNALQSGSDDAKKNLVPILEQFGTDTVVLRTEFTRETAAAMRSSRDWVAVLSTPPNVASGSTMFLRRGSEPYARMEELERAGTLRWPDTAWGRYSRAAFILTWRQPDPDLAISLLQQAAQEDFAVAQTAYPMLISAYAYADRRAEGIVYLERELQRIAPLSVEANRLDQTERVLRAGVEFLRRPPETQPGN